LPYMREYPKKFDNKAKNRLLRLKLIEGNTNFQFYEAFIHLLYIKNRATGWNSLAALYFEFFIYGLKERTNPNPAPIGTGFGFACFSGDEEDRTPDLSDANCTLSRMVRFSPIRAGGVNRGFFTL